MYTRISRFLLVILGCYSMTAVPDDSSWRVSSTDAAAGEVTCIGSDQSVCVCPSACRAGAGCSCVTPEPARDAEVPRHKGADDKDRAAFQRAVIKEFGRNGHACFERNGKQYCLSRATKPTAPITDSEPGRGPLLLCAEAPGGLSDCRAVDDGETADIHCFGEPGAGGGCRCRGASSCATLADPDGKYGSCTGGTCGGACGEKQCCCSY